MKRLLSGLVGNLFPWLTKVSVQGDSTPSGDSLKRPGEFLSLQARKRFAAGTTTPVATSTSTEESDSAKPIDRLHADAIMNYLTRIACQVFIIFEKKKISNLEIWV